MEQVTAIFFSCRRLHLLERTIAAFCQHNTYPIYEMIIVNDSADKVIHSNLKLMYSDFTLVLNEHNIGLMASIDAGYPYINTEYFFHCEDDWMVTKGGFIDKSLAIMTSHAEIEEVWLKDYNKHPMDAEVYKSNGVEYRLASEYIFKGFEGYTNGWHGFTTACALKRISDYKKVAPYADIQYVGNYPKPTIWHREYAIGEAYHKLGYRAAVLIDDEYAENIGIGQSEYVPGNVEHNLIQIKI